MKLWPLLVFWIINWMDCMLDCTEHILHGHSADEVGRTKQKNRQGHGPGSSLFKFFFCSLSVPGFFSWLLKAWIPAGFKHMCALFFNSLYLFFPPPPFSTLNDLEWSQVAACMLSHVYCFIVFSIYDGAKGISDLPGILWHFCYISWKTFSCAATQ